MSKKSRFLSGLLRHFPDDYGLEVHANGWACQSEVVDAMQQKYENFDLGDLRDIVRNDEKGRYEMEQGYIRALYGHSIDVHIEKGVNPQVPDVLYHGTSRSALHGKGAILDAGIKPMGRDRVHLSEEMDDAIEVGERHGEPTVVVIDVDSIDEEIRSPQDGLYTVPSVPRSAIDGVKEPEDLSK